MKEFTKKQREVLVKLVKDWCTYENLKSLTTEQLIVMRSIFENRVTIANAEDVIWEFEALGYNEDEVRKFINDLKKYPCTLIKGYVDDRPDDELPY